jgi:hypothetical protein
MVRVVLKNINPFLFRYVISTRDTQVVVEPSPIAFFNLAFKPLGITLPAEAPSIRNLASQSSTCAKVDAMRTTQQSIDNAVQLSQNPDTVFARRQRFEHDLARVYLVGSTADVVAQSARSGAADLQDYADGIAISLNSIVQIVPTLKAQLNSLAALQVKLKDDSLESACLNVDQAVKAYQQSIDADTKNAALLRTQWSITQAAAHTLAVAASDGTAYYAIYTLPRFDKPTDITVKVTRTAVTPAIAAANALDPVPVADSHPAPPPADPKPAPNSLFTNTVTNTVTPAASPPAPPPSSDAKPPAPTTNVLTEQRLHFGGQPRFSIGAGVIYSPLRNTQFAVQPRRISPTSTQSSDTLGYFVVATDTTPYRVVPAVMLNLALTNQGAPIGLHGTFGAALRTQGAGTDVEYFVGVSPSFFGDRVMLTAALYAGSTQQLNGAALGDRVAATALPVQTVMRIRPAFALSFRVY